MRTLEFHRPPGDVNTENCFLCGTILACNIIQPYLRVLYGSPNKPRLFPHTALNDRFLKSYRGVSSLVIICYISRLSNISEQLIFPDLISVVILGQELEPCHHLLVPPVILSFLRYNVLVNTFPSKTSNYAFRPYTISKPGFVFM
jgi:hypothetical protein